MSAFPPPVGKPPNAGAARTAIANTAQAYANIRNGPGTQYRDVGDILNYTVLAYFPATRTADGWVWVEQFGITGWVSTTVIRFEDIVANPPTQPQTATPYDNKVGVWHWRGDMVAENSIEELARNLRANAPQVRMVYVKVSDYTPSAGAQWMGYWDSKRALAIDGPASIDRWVQVLGQFGLEFHAWSIPRGGNVVAETNLIIQASQRPGVRSMVLDVEPYEGFWMGGRAGVRPYMTRIRRALPSTFHIGMTVDPRPQHYESIFPMEWFPFINSVHPQDYWATFRRSPDVVLEETFRVWGSYGRPILPLLQGDAEASDMRAAHVLATQRYKARSVSWWRLGVIGPVEWPAINQPINVGTQPPPQPPPPGDQYGEEQIVRPDDPTFSIFSYTGQNDTRAFRNVYGWRAYYKFTEPQTAKIAVRWSPRFTRSGRYEISAFIPGRHTTTTNARYKIHGVRGASSEIVVSIDQSKPTNVWVTLGVFEFDMNAINAGTVFLNDLTGETGKKVVFDAVRWREVRSSGSAFLADGYDSPVGTAAERRGTQVWPGQWLDASPFGQLYFIGTPSEAYHTGADLNLPRDADANMPVYAAASGVVTYAARLPVWGNVVIIKHDPISTSRTVMYGRYAHVSNMQVQVGQRVTRGQQIANVSNAFGRWAFHLHFDLSPTTILQTNPEHWPGRNRNELVRNYVDPREFIRANRPRA